MKLIGETMQIKNQPVYYVVFCLTKYASFEKKDEPLCTMAVLTSREAAEEYITGDPFVIKGMVYNWYIREWANMFAM